MGNIRLNYANTGTRSLPNLEIREENNYYPFGLKHRDYNYNIIGVQNNYYKYNGKEYEEVLGLNLYEMDVRSYDPTIGRWTGIDPVIHHSYSPYNAFDNNPIYWADPSGADSQDNNAQGSNSCGNGCVKSFTIRGLPGNQTVTFGASGSKQTEISGGSIGVIQNKDGTYTVINGKNDSNTGIYLLDSNGEFNPETSTKIGNQLTPYSFRLDNNEVVNGIINTKSNEGQKFLDNLVNENPDLVIYAKNAVGGEKYDFKTNEISKINGAITETQFKYRGSILRNGAIASARDIGNIGAGIVAGRKGLSWVTYRAVADGLESKQKGYYTHEKVNSQVPQAMGYVYGRKLRSKKNKKPTLNKIKNEISKNIIIMRNFSIM